jgi:pimeloyl-ACP methyl ester carboxylesterase
MQEAGTAPHRRALRSIVVALVPMALIAITPAANGADRSMDPLGMKAPAEAVRLAPVPSWWTLPAAGSAAPVPCDDDPSFLCGEVRVPIDRSDPTGRTIGIAFQILPHSDPASTATDAVVVTDGGPGISTTARRYTWAFFMGALTDQRDLVLIDVRGTGGSSPIHCADLQDGFGDLDAFERATRRCGDSLGDDADRYGAGDVAKDVEAVRKALGYESIDYVAASWGAVHQQAYAYRYPERVRALVADAGVPVDDPAMAYAYGLDLPASFRRAVTLACERSTDCAAEHTDPGALFDELVTQLGVQPLDGWGRDLFGVRRRVVVDQTALAAIVSNWNTGDARNAGELTAAADALINHDDPAPLLRLGAENPVFPGRQPAARFFSMGESMAASCNDVTRPFDHTAPRDVRRQQYADALGALPAGTFGPFDAEAWDGYWWGGVCAEWPAPDRFVRAIPSGSPPDIPALLLEGELDTVVPIGSVDRLATMYADPTVVKVAGAPHFSMGWTPCAVDIVVGFVDTLDAGDTSCAAEPSFITQAVARFPKAAIGGLEPKPGTGDESTARDRRAAWSTTMTVLDSWLRSFRQPAAVADGAGLRNGWFHVDYANYGDHAQAVLHDARFVRDVAVRGVSKLSYVRPLVKATVRVHGSGTTDGELRIAGKWSFGPPYGTIHITGEIGHRRIELTMPAN